MNIFNRTKAAVLVAIILPGVAVTAYAHDPSMHKKSKEKPNCQAMSKMDKEKMQSGDPVMMAIMKQCEDQMHGADDHAAAGDAEHGDGHGEAHGNGSSMHSDGKADGHHEMH